MLPKRFSFSSFSLRPTLTLLYSVSPYQIRYKPSQEEIEDKAVMGGDLPKNDLQDHRTAGDHNSNSLFFDSPSSSSSSSTLFSSSNPNQPNLVQGHHNYATESDSYSIGERNAALNTLLSISAIESGGKNDWRYISGKFLDQRTRRCILCQENIPDTGFMAHCHSPLHQSREALCLEMLRRNRGTPAEVVARWWHLLDDGLPVHFFKIPKLCVPLPGIIGGSEEQLRREDSLNEDPSSNEKEKSSTTTTSSSTTTKKKFSLKSISSESDKPKRKPFPRRKRTSALENGVVGVDIEDLEELLNQRRDRCVYLLKFLRDAGVLRDCFGGSFDHQHRQVLGRSFHFERLEWVGDNAGKFTVHDRVSSIFPVGEGGARGRLGMISCLMDSNEGLTKGFDFLDLGKILPNFDSLNPQRDLNLINPINQTPCDPSHPITRTIAHTNTQETRAKFKADIMEAMRGELWSFIKSGQISFKTDNANSSPFFRGTALGASGLEAPGSQGLVMLRRLAEHALSEFDTTFLLSHLVQICRLLTNLMRDLKLKIDPRLTSPFMPIQFESGHFRVSQISTETWKKNFYEACVETDFPSSLSQLRHEQNPFLTSTTRSLSKAQKRRLKKKLSRENEEQEEEQEILKKGFNLTLSSEKQKLPERLFAPSLSPRLYSIPRGGITSFPRRLPSLEDQKSGTIFVKQKDFLPWLSNEFIVADDNKWKCVISRDDDEEDVKIRECLKMIHKI